MNPFRFGKHAPVHDYRTLSLKNYLSPEIPQPPATHDSLKPVYTNLKISDPGVLFPMDGNDQYGDCTIAALAHASTLFDGLIGKKKIWSVANVEKLYFHLTGGKDSGLNELDVLNYWQSHVAAGDKILAFTKIDIKNHVHVKQAIQLFGGVYLGFQVQQNCQEEFASHKPWTPGPLTNEGHAVFAVGYDNTYINVLTWGSTQQATWSWWDECVDEAYAILPPQAKKSDFNPGFNFDQLQADLAAVAG